MAESKSEASRILGLRLRERRQALSLNQETVAHRAGLNVSNYARIDRGHGNPTFYTLIRLAGVLGIDASDLLAEFTAEQLPPTRDSCTALDFRREQEAHARRGY
jgi:transcriptional regulator with XRE-family HTH domain